MQNPTRVSSLTNHRCQSSLSSVKPIDLHSRRSISDSVVSRCMGSTITYDNKNTIYMMMNRSGSSTVKKIITAINERCDAVESETASNLVAMHPTPEKEIFILAQWAVDSYYKIIIRSNNGIRAVVRAMRTFSESRGLQECCCLCLGNMCCVDQYNYHGSKSTSFSSSSRLRNANIISPDKRDFCQASLSIIEECNGAHYVLAAMKNFPTSKAIQSAGCDALRNMHELILRPSHSNISDSVCGIDECVTFSTGAGSPHSSSRSIDATEDDNTWNRKATSPTTVTSDDLIHVLTNANAVCLNPMQKNFVACLLHELVDQVQQD